MRKSAKRKPYEAKEKLNQTTGAMASMRETAFGRETKSMVWNTLDRIERGRDDDQMIADAEAKRLRKMERNKPK